MPYADAKYPPAARVRVMQATTSWSRLTAIPLLNGETLVICEDTDGLTICDGVLTVDGHIETDYAVCRINCDGVLAYAYSSDAPERLGGHDGRWSR